MTLTQPDLNTAMKTDADNDPLYKAAIMRKEAGEYVHFAKDLKKAFPSKTASEHYPDPSAENANTERSKQARALKQVRQDFEGEHDESGSATGLTVFMAKLKVDDDDVSEMDTSMGYGYHTVRTANDDMSVDYSACKATKPVRGRGRGWNRNTLKPISENENTLISVEAFHYFCGGKYSVIEEDEELTNDQKKRLFGLMMTGMSPDKDDVYQRIKIFISELEEWTEKIKIAQSLTDRATAIEAKKKHIQCVFHYL